MGTDPGPADLCSTAWSLVFKAQSTDKATSRRGLDLLIERYWRPVYHFIRRFGKSHEDAKDLTQGFFTNFIERDAVSYADSSRGKFRSFLLASVKRFMAQKHRADARGPLVVGVENLDAAASEPAFREAEGRTPERIFMKNWARSVMENCVARLRAECEVLGKGVQFRAFEERFLSGTASAPTYREMAGKLGITESNVRKFLESAKKRFRRILRDEVANSMAAGSDVRQEIAEIRESLSS